MLEIKMLVLLMLGSKHIPEERRVWRASVCATYGNCVKVKIEKCQYCVTSPLQALGMTAFVMKHILLGTMNTVLYCVLGQLPLCITGLHV